MLPSILGLLMVYLNRLAPLYSLCHPPTQTDQPNPSDNAHTHMDSAHPITLLDQEKDTALSPYHNSESDYKATFFIFILPRKAKRAFGIIRVILRFALSVTSKLHLAPRIQPSCPTGLPAFTEYLSRVPWWSVTT